MSVNLLLEAKPVEFRVRGEGGYTFSAPFKRVDTTVFFLLSDACHPIGSAASKNINLYLAEFWQTYGTMTMRLYKDRELP